MKKYSLFLFAFFCLFINIFVCYAEKDVWDETTETKMSEVDSIMAEIKRLPAAIDEDLCKNDRSSYKQHLTLLAQKIIDANTIMQDVKTVYPVDLWSVYNMISSNPVCGIGKKASSVFGVADVSRYFFMKAALVTAVASPSDAMARKTIRCFSDIWLNRVE